MIQGHWLLGSARAFAAAPDRFVAEVAAASGGLVRFRVLNRWIVAAADAECVRQILVDHQQRYVRSFHYQIPVIGDGLLSTDGPRWLKRRRQVQPAFRERTLQQLVEVVNEASDQLLVDWEQQRHAGEVVEIVAEMQQLTLSVIGHALLSTEVGRERGTQFASAVRDALRLLRRRNTSIIRLPSWAPTPLNRQMARTRAVLDGFIRPIIATRRLENGLLGEFGKRGRSGEHGKRGEHGNRAERDNRGKREDLLTALLAVRDPDTGDALDDQAILDETKTLFAAGFETTATALTWTLYLLARHPQVAERWHAELDRVLNGRPPTWEDLERLSYTKQLLNESLRLYPPVYNMARLCIQHDEIRGYAIPKGTLVLLSILGVHHDPHWWPDPQAFRPERFAEDWPRQAFIPFATGKHLCIGNNFSLTEMLVVLARIGQRFDLDLLEADPVGTIAHTTRVPDRPIPVRLRPMA